MTSNPWTDPDPQPGDFDAELAKLDPRYVEHHEGDPDAKLIVLVGVEGRTPSAWSGSPTLAARKRPMSSPSCSETPSAHSRKTSRTCAGGASRREQAHSSQVLMTCERGRPAVARGRDGTGAPLLARILGFAHAGGAEAVPDAHSHRFPTGARVRGSRPRALRAPPTPQTSQASRRSSEVSSVASAPSPGRARSIRNDAWRPCKRSVASWLSKVGAWASRQPASGSTTPTA